jgi:hypothetical protein
LLAVAGRRHRRGEAAAPDITAARFALTPTVGESTLVLFAQARRPRRGPVG